MAETRGLNGWNARALAFANQIICNARENAEIYRKMSQRSQRINNRITLVVKFCTITSGVGGAVSAAVNEAGAAAGRDALLAMAVVGMVMGFVGAVAVMLRDTWHPAETQSKTLTAGVQYSEISQTMTLHLTLPARKRQRASAYLGQMSNKMHRLELHSPLIEERYRRSVPGFRPGAFPASSSEDGEDATSADGEYYDDRYGPDDRGSPRAEQPAAAAVPPRHLRAPRAPVRARRSDPTFGARLFGPGDLPPLTPIDEVSVDVDDPLDPGFYGAPAPARRAGRRDAGSEPGRARGWNGGSEPGTREHRSSTTPAAPSGATYDQADALGAQADAPAPESPPGPRTPASSEYSPASPSRARSRRRRRRAGRDKRPGRGGAHSPLPRTGSLTILMLQDLDREYRAPPADM